MGTFVLGVVVVVFRRGLWSDDTMLATVLKHIALCVPSILIAAYTERLLRDHQWAFSAIEDQLISFRDNEHIAPGQWAHLSSSAFSVTPALTDTSFGVTASGAVRLRRQTEYCQWQESATEECSEETQPDGSSSTRCVTSYSYSKSWLHVRVESGGFREPSHHNPSSDPFPSREFVTQNLKIGQVSVPAGIVSTLVDCVPTPVTQAAENIDIGDNSPAAHAQFQMNTQHTVDQGGWVVGWLYANFKHSVREPHSWGNIKCSAGDIRVSWQMDAPDSLTAIGEVSADHVLQPILTDKGPHTVGLLHAGLLTAPQAFSVRLSPVWWRVVPARLLLLVVCVSEVYIWSRHLGLWWSTSHLFSALVFTIGACSCAICLGTVWAILYGLNDWRGMETSAPQLWLLVNASSALAVLALASAQSRSSVVNHLVRLSVRLHRVSDSLFNITTIQAPHRRVAAVDRLRTSSLVIALCAGMVLSFMALTGGALGESHYWLIWWLGVATTAMAAMLLIATVLTRERLSNAGNSARNGNVGDTQMDCPVCLESVPAADGLVLSPCGHTLCRGRFTAMNAASNVRGKCPVCRADVRNTITVSDQVAEWDDFNGNLN